MTATPPTFVAKYETSWTTTSTPKTVTPTIAANDTLVIIGLTGNDTTQINTPTDDLTTHLTYTLQQTIQVTDYCFARLWTAPVDGGQSGSFTLSAGRTATAEAWGFSALRFSGVSGIGATAKTNVASGAPSLSLSTTQENSAVVAFSADWTATDGSTRTWRTVNSITPTSGNGLEQAYALSSGVYTIYGAYWSDAGAAGANNYGLSAPGAQKYSIVAVELKGVLSGGPAGFGVGFFDGI
jgi:hypothetical protein